MSDLDGADLDEAYNRNKVVSIQDHYDALKRVAARVREHDKHDHASFALSIREQAMELERQRCIDALSGMSEGPAKQHAIMLIRDAQE